MLELMLWLIFSSDLIEIFFTIGSFWRGTLFVDLAFSASKKSYLALDSLGSVIKAYYLRNTFLFSYWFDYLRMFVDVFYLSSIVGIYKDCFLTYFWFILLVGIFCYSLNFSELSFIFLLTFDKGTDLL